MERAVVAVRAEDSVQRASKRPVSGIADFRSLLGEPAWLRLPATVRERFAFGAHAAITIYGYFFRVGSWRLNIPDWFPPGMTCVVHEDKGNGRFRFVMRTSHAWFGEMFVQDGEFS
jgi:Domain of unknown function (DUF4166)